MKKNGKNKTAINFTIDTPEEEESLEILIKQYRASSRSHAIRLAITDKANDFKKLMEEERDSIGSRIEG